MNILMVAGIAVVVAASVTTLSASRSLYGGGLDALAEQPARMLDALEAEFGADTNLRRPDEGFWHAVEQGHPYLAAAVDFDEQLPAEDRARYDTFWTALRDQDAAFWSSLGRGDDRRWAQLEDQHGVLVPFQASVGGGS